ncbi:MAG: glutamine synthetase family protein [Muribaculum sp.]|nr:glutamine synthetase family protein [Muribaculum sp.]
MNLDKKIAMNRNHVVSVLQKSASEFTRADIIDYIISENIEMVNFMYPAADGRLKTLNFIINNLEYLETILSTGERVDGSSLFPFIETSRSDLYVIPRYSTAFRDPFAEIPTLTMLCSFFDKAGQPWSGDPRGVLKRACDAFKEVSGLDFEAMGELEFYVIAADPGTFPATDQKGYHESAPFAKFNDFRTKAMQMIASTGGQIKYGHSEVGNFTLKSMVYEQNEIEFLPSPALDAADHLMLAKWVIRNLAAKDGFNVTFAPKITVGKAGSGFHIHMRLMKDGQNVTQTADRKLSDEAKKAIAGLMTLAPAITAFGNNNPTSYLRLVPHQEAPTSICWGDSNRSVLVRVPLGWTSGKDMCGQVNSNSPCEMETYNKQTFEMRSPDCSANVYQLIAALCVAARFGFQMANPIEVADNTYVDVDIHSSKNSQKLAQLETLPTCCVESAEALDRARCLFEAFDVFAPELIDDVIKRLKAFDDKHMAEYLKENPEQMLKIVNEYFYCG